MKTQSIIGSSRQPSSWQILFCPKTPLEKPSTTDAPYTGFLNLILRTHLAINELSAGRNPTRSGVPLSGLTLIAVKRNRIPMLRLQRLQFKLSFDFVTYLSRYTWGQVKVFTSIGRWQRWWIGRRGSATLLDSKICVTCTVWKLGASELRTYRASSGRQEPTIVKE